MGKEDLKIKKLVKILKKSKHWKNEHAYLTYYLELPNGDAISLSKEISIGEFQLCPEMTFTFKICESEKEFIEKIKGFKKEW